MKWILGIIIALGLSLSAEAKTCYSSPDGFNTPRYSTHLKGHEGTKCWHSSKTGIKIVFKYKVSQKIIQEFEQWKRDQYAACALGMPKCLPYFRNHLFDKAN